MTDPELAEIQANFREFETVTLRRLPLYRYLAGRIARDPDVAALLRQAPPERRWSTLLFAAVHDRLLEVFETVDADPEAAARVEPLCAWYPSTAAQPRPVGDGRSDPWPRFRTIALDDPRVIADIATRGTQTNEVGRSATTVLALAQVQAEVDRPLAVVEVGASAGLNLLLDRHRYRYRPDGTTGSDPSEGPGRHRGESPPATPDRHGRRHDAEDGSAVTVLEPAVAASVGEPLTLEARWRGPRRPPVPTAMPVIGTRIGVDAQPIDVTDPVASRWLVACQWPEQLERLDRCRQAIAVARTEPPRIVEGDLVDEIRALLTAVPAHHHPVVLSTWCLAYLEEREQIRFLDRLDRAAEDRDLTLVYQEQPIAVPGLDPPVRPDGVDDHRPTALCRQDWRDGARTAPVRLADQHPHGTWLRWFD